MRVSGRAYKFELPVVQGRAVGLVSSVEAANPGMTSRSITDIVVCAIAHDVIRLNIYRGGGEAEWQMIVKLTFLVNDISSQISENSI